MSAAQYSYTKRSGTVCDVSYSMENDML